MIKLLADENIPIKSVKALRRKNIDIIPVLEVSPSLSDRAVVDLANRQGRIIVTFDKDFGELVFRQKLKVKGMILLRFIPKSPEHVTRRIEYLLASGIPIENCFAVVREDSVRVIPVR